MNAKGCSSAFTVFLVLALLVSTSPVSGAELTRPSIVLGSISVVGDVQVRGTSQAREGTIFSGDQVRTINKGYARITLSNGNRFEASGAAEFVVNQDTNGIRVGLTSGHLGFIASSNPLAFSVGRYEIVPNAGTTGGIGFLGPDTAAINVLNGSVTLRESVTRQSMVIPPGGQYTFNLKANGPIARLVSVIPTSVPTVAPPAQNPPPTSQTGGSNSWLSKKAALLIGGAAAVAIALVATGGEEECDETCRAQKAQVQQIADLTLKAGQQAAAAIAPFLASNQVANAQNAVITSLLAQLNRVLAQLQNENPSPSEVKQLLATAQSLQEQMNAALNALTAAGVPGDIPPKVPSSLSRPE